MWFAILFGASGTLLAGLLLGKYLEREAGVTYALKQRAQLDSLTLSVRHTVGTWLHVVVQSVSRDVVLKGVHGASMVLLLGLRSLEHRLTQWVVRVRAKRRSLPEMQVRKFLLSMKKNGGVGMPDAHVVQKDTAPE